ncbi:RNA 2',3'-cyclic phosphodiesterase [candidate division KSB1 bacterium]|nr:RNA 2',3'-cyclic phosphodiesterase [candidate division KSB1 bacterium]
MRLFVAVDIPAAWKTDLAEIERAIGWLGRGVKWVDPQSMHLTLKFLGETDDRDLQIVRDQLTAACSDVPAFTMQMRGTGAFPAPNRPRVYWVGLKSGDALITLNQKIETAMQAIGYPPEENPFKPHLTVARIKDPIGKARQTDALLSYHVESEPVLVRDVLLMRSHLAKEGARYEVVGRATLNDDR